MTTPKLSEIQVGMDTQLVKIVDELFTAVTVVKILLEGDPTIGQVVRAWDAVKLQSTGAESAIRVYFLYALHAEMEGPGGNDAVQP